MDRPGPASTSSTVVVAVIAVLLAVVVLAAIVISSGLFWPGGRQPPPAGGGQGLRIAVAADGSLAVAPHTVDAGVMRLELSNASDTYWALVRVEVESDEDVERLLGGDHQGLFFDVFESLEPMRSPIATRIELEPGLYAFYIQSVEAAPANGGSPPIERRQLAVVEAR